MFSLHTRLLDLSNKDMLSIYVPSIFFFNSRLTLEKCKCKKLVDLQLCTAYFFLNIFANFYAEITMFILRLNFYLLICKLTISNGYDISELFFQYKIMFSFPCLRSNLTRTKWKWKRHQNHQGRGRGKGATRRALKTKLKASGSGWTTTTEQRLRWQRNATVPGLHWRKCAISARACVTLDHVPRGTFLGVSVFYVNWCYFSCW